MASTNRGPARLGRSAADSSSKGTACSRSALTILRQSLDELEVRIVRKDFRSGGHGPVHERDRASEFLPGSRQEQTGQAVALGHGPVVGAVSEAFEEGLAGPTVRFLVAEEQAQAGA